MSQKDFDKEASPGFWRKWYVVVLVAHALVILGLYLFTLAFHT